MAYACNCDAVNSFSGFTDSFKDVAEIGLPTLGGLSGLQSGYEQGGFLQGLNQGLAGVIKGYTALNATSSSGVPLNSSWNGNSNQGVPFYDPFTSPQYGNTSQYIYYPQKTAGEEMQSRIQAAIISSQTSTTEKILGLDKTTFLLLAGAGAIVILVLLIKK
jgi:hypothetical protein